MFHAITASHEDGIALVVGKCLQLFHHRNGRKDVSTRATSGDEHTKALI
jgi:hypothetical protein